MRIIPSFLILLTLVASVSAEDILGQLKNTFKLGFESSDGKLGYYGGLSLGQSEWEPAIQYTPGVSIDEEDTVYRLFFGVPLNDTYAVEFGFSETAASLTAPNGAFIISRGNSFVTTSAGTADMEFRSLSIGVRGLWPLVESLRGVGKLGIHRWESDLNLGPIGGPTLTESGMDVYLGIGLDYYWNEYISFRAEIERVMEEEEVDLFMVGGALHF